MTTNEVMIAATLMVGNKFYTCQEIIAAEAWEAMSSTEQAAYKHHLQYKLASSIAEHEIACQVQISVTAEPAAYTYRINSGKGAL